VLQLQVPPAPTAPAAPIETDVVSDVNEEQVVGHVWCWDIFPNRRGDRRERETTWEQMARPPFLPKPLDSIYRGGSFLSYSHGGMRNYK
jgi:hypothetical protein